MNIAAVIRETTVGRICIRGIALAFLPVFLVIFSPDAWGEQVTVNVISAKGKPVAGAVVTAVPASGAARQSGMPSTTIIDQIDKEYIGHVTPVMVGTGISFPNHDNIRHHVYSFSSAKKFEIPLYLGTPRDPIVFDKTGSVSLGCNIHDWMSAYVYIVDTPYFATTDEDGKAAITLPEGEYTVQVWHPRLKGSPKSTAQKVAVGGAAKETAFKIKLKKVWKPRRAPVSFGGVGGGYR